MGWCWSMFLCCVNVGQYVVMLESVALVAQSCIAGKINHTCMTSTPCGVGDPDRFRCALLYKSVAKLIKMFFLSYDPPKRLLF